MTDAQIQAKATIAAALIQSRSIDAEALGSLNKDISNHKLAHLRELTERIYAAIAKDSTEIGVPRLRTASRAVASRAAESFSAKRQLQDTGGRRNAPTPQPFAALARSAACASSARVTCVFKTSRRIDESRTIRHAIRVFHCRRARAHVLVRVAGPGAGRPLAHAAPQSSRAVAGAEESGGAPSSTRSGTSRRISRTRLPTGYRADVRLRQRRGLRGHGHAFPERGRCSTARSRQRRPRSCSTSRCRTGGFG